MTSDTAARAPSPLARGNLAASTSGSAPIAPAKTAAPTHAAGGGAKHQGSYPFATFHAHSYFNALDGLRAVSILLVLLHHVPDFTPGFLRTLQMNGRYGVSFFFVVSGFLICTLLLRERDRTGHIAWGKFYARRALRLLPLYYVTLGLQCILVFALHQYSPENQALFREKLPAYAFYYSNWLATATQGPFFYAWSLAVEEQFYLGFGLLLWFLPRRGLATLLAAALVTKFAVYELFGSVDAHSTLWRVVFSYQEGILWGVLLGFALHRRRSYEAIARCVSFRGATVVLGAAIGGFILVHPMQSQSTWDAQLLYVLMAATVAAVVIRTRTRVLSTRLLVHIGKISYGIYLLHTLIIYAVKKLPFAADPMTCFLISAPISIVLASVVYRTFEQPIIVYYKRRLSPLAKTSPVAQTDATALPDARAA